MTASETVTLHHAPLTPNYRPRADLVRGEGCRVWDADGKEYLDLLAGIAVLGVGHCHPKVVGAIQEQAGRLMHVSNLYFNEHQPRLAQALSERSLGGRCYFCNSGAEANEALIKLARLWGNPKGRNELLSMRNSFHGRTLGAMTATGQDKVQAGYDPLPTGFAYADFNDLDSVRAAINEHTVGILVEPIQGEGGVVAATPEFMTGLQALCDEHDLLLLCDEIQCGMGRTGEWFGYQRYGVRPDAISVAKSLGGGLPIGAIVAGERLGDLFQPGRHATTFGGNPVACAAGRAVIDVIEDEGLLANAKAMGERLLAGLRALADEVDCVVGARGVGLMMALLTERPTPSLERALLEEGVLALTTAGTAIRLLPPLSITAEEVDEGLERIGRAVRRWAGAGA